MVGQASSDFTVEKDFAYKGENSYKSSQSFLPG